jgi:pimeloyl-ACP methyl ester carboxylesterase
MPLPKRVVTNGIRMAVYERGEGVPVIFCHGFPELAYSWRHSLEAAAAAGFRAIAPDLRGYGLTDRPGAVADYAATEVCADLAGMMDLMGLDKAVFCGHDWGGYVADTLAALYPERCMGLIGAGSPHNYRPRGLPPPDVRIESLVDKAAFNRFMQQPDVPDELLNRHVGKFFEAFGRSGYMTADYLSTLPADSPERRMDLPAILARGDYPGTPFLARQTLGYYVETFSNTGFSGAINWYRAMPTTIAELEKREVGLGLNVPYLYIWFEQDPIIRAGHEAWMTDYIEDFEMRTIDCGHIGLEEKPERLSAAVTDWLRRKFAA